MTRTRGETDHLEHAASSGDTGARIELANHLLGSHRHHEPGFERGLAMLTEAAEKDAHPEARWYLGALYLTVTVLPDAHARAARWLALAARDGVPQAADRLADLHLQGLGIDQDEARALALQRELAERGFQLAAWSTGYLLDRQGDAAGAATAFARCWALGHPEGYYSLGLRFVQGAGVPADPAFGRALLIRADDAGIRDARAAADDFAPRKTHGREAKRWYDRLKACHRAAQPMFGELAHLAQRQFGLNPVVKRLEAHFAALDHPAIQLDSDGRLRTADGGSGSLAVTPPAPEWLGQRPRVALFRAFATREECAHLVAFAESRLAEVNRRFSARDDPNYFDGRDFSIGPLYADAVVRTLERRAAHCAGHPPENWEPSSIVQYSKAQQYRPHVDYFTEEMLRANREQFADPGGQRLASFLLYLKAADSGGETAYPDADLEVPGETGLSILHYNCLPDGSVDERSRHAGKPIEQGEKWLWRTALRQYSLIPKLRIQPDSEKTTSD